MTRHKIGSPGRSEKRARGKEPAGWKKRGRRGGEKKTKGKEKNERLLHGIPEPEKHLENTKTLDAKGESSKKGGRRRGRKRGGEKGHHTADRRNGKNVSDLYLDR